MAPRKDNQHFPDVEFEKLVKVDDHKKDVGELTKSIQDINQRILILEDKVGTKESMAKMMLEIQVDNKTFDLAIANSLLEIIKSNIGIQEALKKFIDEQDRNVLSLTIKRFKNWIIGVVLIVIGLAGREIITALAKLILKQ